MATEIDYDNLELTGWPMPDCSFCKYLDLEKGGFPLTCPAFPDGIPNEINTMGGTHREKVEGQVGDYVFEKDEMYIK